MGRFGIGLIWVGAGLMAWALVMQVGVSPDSAAGSLRPGTVANIDLIGQRQVIAVVGGAAFVGGWIALATATLRGALARRDGE